MVVQKSVVKSRVFGELEVSEENIIFFEEGIPAFENLKKFVIIKEDESPFYWLQSIEDKDIAFVIINPFEIKPDYEFDLPDEVVSKLEIDSPQDVAVFSIVVIPEDVKQTRVNLKAPIIINVNKRKGMQYLLDDERYPLRYYLFENSNSNVQK
ncbi:flagellar assembly protein FliW [Caldicellulosiruptor acetigenus]|uniref:Flagellar assembly factor FliW n=1 Tax=Caldicellulosiruptor acetigenus 6A TaxID=632516 RepID=G2PVZ8_9FIRM|nr:flagellar assembly protein FliW [Caldicellulosiruptor acetigenus]AEM73716.1 Flagellar assembly factor fliW [Caldicellulosiruptor acetigenus 6A]